MLMASTVPPRNCVKLLYKGHQILNAIFGIIIGSIALLRWYIGRVEFNRTASVICLVDSIVLALVYVLPQFIISRYCFFRKGSVVGLEAYIWTGAMVLDDYVALLMINIGYFRILLIPIMILVFIFTLGWESRKSGTVKVSKSENDHDGVNSEKLELFNFVSYLLLLSFVTWTQYKGRQGCTPVLSDFLLFLGSALGALETMLASPLAGLNSRAMSAEVLPVLHKTRIVVLFIAVHTLAAEWLGDDMIYVCLPELITVLVWFTVCFDESTSISSLTSYKSQGTIVSSVVAILACLIPWNGNDRNMPVSWIIWLFWISISWAAFSRFHVWLLQGWPGSSSESKKLIPLLNVCATVGSIITILLLCAYMMIIDTRILCEAIYSSEDKAMSALVAIGFMLAFLVWSVCCRPGQPETQIPKIDTRIHMLPDSMAAAATIAYDVGTILTTGERDYLIRNSGEQVKISSIEGGTVALYFSASWCPPCKRFMPKLIEAYKELASHGKSLEVVMVSSDPDEEAFSTYFANMPWLAVPFSDSEGRKGLDERFEVTRVPHLVILDAKTGEVLTEEGVEFVSAYGIESYPFTPERINKLKEQEKAAKDNQTIHSLLGTPNRDYLISKKGDKVPIADLEGKYVGLCFVVNGYGPVEEFTTVLAKIYGKLKEVGEKFEVVTVSIDSDEASFNESFSNMPWLAIPPGDKTCEKLVRYFELSDLPTLVLIGPDGKTLNRNIADIVSEHGLEAWKGFPFNAEKLEILAEKAKAKAESQTLDSLLVIGDLDFVIRKDGAKVPVAELVGKTVLLYFSAQWCGPARAFQTVLVDVYKKIKEKNCDFEMVFISSDRDTSSFDDFFSGMPWFALPLKDERKAYLNRMFKIRGIPSVVTIGPDGKTVNTDAKTSLVVHGADAFPFTDERLQELEKKMDEMAKGWPQKLRHDLHEHELVLTRRPRPFGCDGCDGMGGSWSYRCEACDFDLHTSCALREENKGEEVRLQEVEKRNDEMTNGCPSAQKKKGRPEKHMHEHVLTGQSRGYICNGSDEIGTSPGYLIWLAINSNILSNLVDWHLSLYQAFSHFGKEDNHQVALRLMKA